MAFDDVPFLLHSIPSALTRKCSAGKIHNVPRHETASAISECVQDMHSHISTGHMSAVKSGTKNRWLLRQVRQPVSSSSCCSVVAALRSSCCWEAAAGRRTQALRLMLDDDIISSSRSFGGELAKDLKQLSSLSCTVHFVSRTLT